MGAADLLGPRVVGPQPRGLRARGALRGRSCASHLPVEMCSMAVRNADKRNGIRKGGGWRERKVRGRWLVREGVGRG
eukprot:930593-Rhodomonas_salina.1